MRQGKTGLACTDGQNQWNSGAKKNAGRHKIKHMSFKRHNRHTFYRIPPSKTSPPKASTKSSPVYLIIKNGGRVHLHHLWLHCLLPHPMASCNSASMLIHLRSTTICCYLCPLLSALLSCCYAMFSTFVCLALLPCLLSPLSVLFALLVCCYAFILCLLLSAPILL